ncbi:hypothetical protein EVD32_15845 [Bacteroidales bacterium SW299]|nr:hypothetical protein [Bacteroidales bacterium SW299]
MLLIDKYFTALLRLTNTIFNLFKLERLNFPIKYFIRPFLSLFPVCFPTFTRQTACYHPHEIRKTSLKTIRKINLHKI